MTREEAIKLFEEMESKEMYWQLQELCDLAIEALLADTKAVYCWECKYQHECVQSIVIEGKNEIIHSCSYGERREP